MQYQYDLPRCDAMEFARYVLTFRMKLLALPSGQYSKTRGKTQVIRGREVMNCVSDRANGRLWL
jgi:hypothetical protein